MGFGFEYGQEAGFAEFLAVFGPDYYGACRIAVGAEAGWHFDLFLWLE